MLFSQMLCAPLQRENRYLMNGANYNRVFLLSPAKAGGERGKMLVNPRAGFDLAVRLRRTGAPIGEVYAFISGLYFRGKIAYSEAFAATSLVITPGRGLLPVDTPIMVDDFLEIAAVPIDVADSRYREPLERDARVLAGAVGPLGEIVLLGSVATTKYVEPLLKVFGQRLLFPAEFVGRGDMSRGGLMLRSARAGVELSYISVLGATLHGPRPPRLPRLER